MLCIQFKSYTDAFHYKKNSNNVSVKFVSPPELVGYAISAEKKAKIK